MSISQIILIIIVIILIIWVSMYNGIEDPLTTAIIGSFSGSLLFNILYEGNL